MKLKNCLSSRNTKLLCALVFLLSMSVAGLRGAETSEQFRRLPIKEYRDKMKAAWIGQIAGVSWGAPTEFKWREQIIPADKMPPWKSSMINDAFGQDDLYGLYPLILHIKRT